MIRFQSLTRNIEIGANCYLLSLGDKRILIDSGMHPKAESKDALPQFDRILDEPLDAAILSHAHLDHSGSLPVIQRHYPEMPVFMSEATDALAQALLHNSVNVMTSKREELGINEYPFFTHREIHKVNRQWHPRRNGRKFELHETGGASCTFYDAGHIMGAVSPLFEFSGKKILYTGDVHFEDQSILKGADLPSERIDVLILECTRGGASRDPEYTRWSEAEKLALRMEECLEGKGSVMIPLFAMGRTQETIMMLHELQRARKLRNSSFLIGGLSIKMTKIYDRFSNRIRRNHQGLNLMRVKGLLSTPRFRGELPKLEQGNVYTLSSGMMTEKTMSNRLAQQFIANPRHLVACVGYADPDSPMARLIGSERGEEVLLDSKKEPVKRQCSVQSFDFSGHAPRESLIEYAESVHPKKIILVHGDKEAIEWMKQRLGQRLPETEVIIPDPGKEIDLE
ncbi:MAG: MBL fold metallo-hydrolase [Verrucomicrobiales bacterium]|nr:MBL fold metallo-hydrolase [Verrucomicrobiales bacterium]